MYTSIYHFTYLSIIYICWLTSFRYTEKLERLQKMKDEKDNLQQR